MPHNYDLPGGVRSTPPAARVVPIFLIARRDRPFALQTAAKSVDKDCLGVFYHGSCDSPIISRPATTEESALSFVHSDARVARRQLTSLTPSGDRTLTSCSSVGLLQILFRTRIQAAPQTPCSYGNLRFSASDVSHGLWPETTR